MRACIEALMQVTPITAGLARLYQETHPPKSQEDLLRWIDDVTTELNHVAELVPIISGSVTMGSNPISLSSHGVSSFADSGTGDYFVTFLETITTPYHVSIWADNATAIVTEKSSNGFRIKTHVHDASVDADFTFLVSRIS